MKPRTAAVASASLAIAAWLMAQIAAPPASPLASFPQGAMLALDFRDFKGVLAEWNGSNVKREWLASASYDQFAVSRLAQRLGEAQQEFAAAVTAPAGMTLLEQIAGDRTAIALYSAGDLEFLVATRIPEARFATSVLGRRRATLSPRNTAGTGYFVASNPASRRTVAFAIRGEWLYLATTEPLLAECLQRLTAASANGLTAEEWFARGAPLAGAAGEIRMAANIEALYRSPHFRSYWIHRNRAELAPFSATFSDLDRQGPLWTERRVLVRKQTASPAPVDPAVLPALLRAVPPAAGFYRAWLQPDPRQAADLLVRKLADPYIGPGKGSDSAPLLPAIAEAGEENAWEDRIDRAPFVAEAAGPDYERLRRWLETARLTGMLHVQSTRDSADNVWIAQDTGFLMLREGDWNAAAVRAEIDALQKPLAYEIDGNRLFLANRAELLASLRNGNTPAAAPAGARFYGGFRHGAERERFARWMRQIDRPSVVPAAPGQPPPPPDLLSDQIAGLSRVLRGVAEQTVVITDLGDRVNHTIAYRIQP